MIWISGVILLFIGVPVMIGFYISGPKYQGLVTQHFDGRKFNNLSGASAHGFKAVFKWMTDREQGPWKKITKANYGPKPPAVTHSVRVTFINHSSFLIQVDGVNILTDPVYSERVSPFSWIGPKRMRPPGIRFEDLPEIHYVLLSHNHYDHLDKSTVKQLNKRFQPMFITPLGVDKLLQKYDIHKVVALDWWQEMPLQTELSVAAVPAQHFSGRGMFDRDATLWCGYVLKRPDGNIYFAGDTGYDKNIFKEIGESMAPIALAFIPIGAYKPRWFMSPIHISPEEAVQVHKDVQPAQSVAIHFGTFPLADEGQQEPITDLLRVLKDQKVPEKEFWVLEEGEGRNL